LRWADGHEERFPELTAELLASPVDILVTGSEAAARAAEQATASIPIVIWTSSDPVGSGLVPSLARPGSNITGLSSISPQLSAKRLELLKTACPGIVHVTVLGNAATADVTPQFREAEATAQVLGIQLSKQEAQGADNLDAILAALAEAPMDALLVLAQALFIARRTQIVTFAAERRIP